MDIVGVTASAATLIEVTGAIATTITTVVTAVRTADSRLTALSTELSQLTQYLQSVHRTLVDCRATDLSLIEDELWHHSEICLAGCQGTLNELGQVVNGVKTKAQKVFKLGSLGWKSRAAIELGLRGPELECFRERLYKSNSALQTMLHTINVSLSIRSNKSQNSILHELSRLKTSIDAALYASSLSSPICKGGRSYASAARNLRDLASAAQTFHSAASSSAGTVRGDNGSILCLRNDSITISNEPWQAGPDTPSLQGDFPPERRERVEMFIRQGRRRHPRRDASIDSYSRPPSLGPLSPILSGTTLTAPPIEVAVLPHVEAPRQEVTLLEEDDNDDDDDDEFERAFTVALRQLALDRIKTEHYDKATQFLHEALKRSEADANENSEVIDRLNLQLSLCYILQGTWLLADPLIARLGTVKCDVDISPLLHAVALGHLATYSFDCALTSCRLALRVQKRRCKLGMAVWEEYPETLGLLATIYDMMGEGIRAEVARSQLPRWYVYQHPTSEVDFMKSQTRFLETVLGYHVPSFLDTGCHELDDGSGRDALVEDENGAAQDILSPIREGVWDAACDVTQLRTNWSRHERLEGDTCKEVVEAPFVSGGQNAWVKDDADDECSPITPSDDPVSPFKGRVTRFFRPRRQRRAEEATSPTDQVSPVSPLSPQRPALWRRAFKRRLPKPVVKPLTMPVEETGQQSFRLLRMERIRTPDVTEPPVSPQEPTRAFVQESSVLDTVYHELDDSGVDMASPSPLDSRAFAERALEDARRKRKDVVAAHPPSSSPSDGISATSLPWQPYDFDMHMNSLVQDESVESNEVDPREADQSEIPSPQKAATEPSTSPTAYRLPKRRGLDSIRVDTAAARSMASQAKLNLRAPHLSDELGDAIRTLANVFSDLPAITGAHKKIVDVEAVLCKVQELQELKGQFIALGTDSTMVMDIEAAIRRLEALVKRYNQRSRQNSKQTSAVNSQIKAPAAKIQERSAAKPVYQGESDSGYESMEPPRQHEQHKSSRRLEDQDFSDSGEEEWPLKCLSTSASDFTRSPSFRAGDDRLGLESLKETLGEVEAVTGTAR